MIRTLRAISLVPLLAVTVGAQSGRVPPRPPTPPVVRPTPPVPPRADVAPMTPLRPATPRALIDLRDLDVDLSGLRIDLNELTSKLKFKDEDLRMMSQEASRELSREVTRAAMEQSREAMEQSREAMQQALFSSRDAIDRGLFSAGIHGALRVDPAQHYQSDPADSLYRQAAALFNNGDWRAAAQRFKELQQKYPNSQYVSKAMYYQAFSLYRANSDAELKESSSILEQHLQRFPNARYNSGNGAPSDAAALLQRVRGYLADRGDASAKQALRAAADGSGVTCDREEQAIKTEALSALMRVDPEATLPKLNDVLARRDECSTSLRRNALSILTQRGDEKSVATLLATAKSDPSSSIRADAVSFVSRFPSDEVYQTLESMARSEANEEVRRSAARSLVGYPSPRARQLVRGLIEDNTIPDNVRTEMLSKFTAETGTAEDATWLRASYAKVTSPSVRRSIVGAVARIGGADAQKWLMDLASNDQEPASIRADAFRRSSTNMSTQDLIKAYDAAGSTPQRTSIVRALNERKDDAALNKLIDILKPGRETDPDVRRQVMNMLGERTKDPKVAAALLELIGK
jgi:HEAT repeat protein